MTAFFLKNMAGWEAACRARVGSAPDDLHARADLAWCLLMQYLYRAGEADAGRPPEGPTPASPSPEALLTGCLRQALVVRLLSTGGQDRADIDRLKSLVKVCHGEGASREESWALSTIARMRRDMNLNAAPFSDKRSEVGDPFRPASPSEGRGKPRGVREAA